MSEELHYLSKPGRALADYLSERSTVATFYAPDVPPTSHGSEAFIAAEGATVTASGLGCLKAGTPITIIARWQEAGFCYYQGADRQVHRTKDIVVG